MSFTLETEYVAPDKLNLETCGYCGRRFFSQSLQKHVVACEKEWIRGNCGSDKKNRKERGPLIKEHITGYDINVKTFSDMLALGAERRMRWRMRHEEFIRTIKTAKANTQREHVELPEVTQAGLTQCEYCKRKFNDAAFIKHKDQCKSKQANAQPEQTEEQKEAKLRFLKRMKYNLKLANKKKLGEDLYENQIDENVSSSANEELMLSENSEILNALATELCLGFDGSKTPSSNLFQTHVLNKLLQHNLTSLFVNTPVQMSNCNHANGTDSSSSLPFFSASSLESTSAAPSAIIFPDKSPIISKTKQHCGKTTQSPTSSIKTAEQVNADSVQRKTSSNNTTRAVAINGNSSHRTGSCRSLVPPPTVVNNFMNDVNDEDALRRQFNKKEEKTTGRGGHTTENDSEKGRCKKSEITVLLEANEVQSNSQSRNQKCNMKKNELRRIAEGDQNSPVVFYTFNSAGTDASREQKTSQKKYPLHLKIPRQLEDEVEGEGVEVEEEEEEEGGYTTTLVTECGIPSPRSRTAAEETEASVASAWSRTPRAPSSGLSDTTRDTQSLTLKSHHRSGYHHHRRKNLESVGASSGRSSGQSHDPRANCCNEDGRKKTISRYCPHCGKKFPSTARFCSSCGAMRKSKVTAADPHSTASSHRLPHAFPGKDVTYD